MNPQPSSWTVDRYLDARGESPVEEFLDGLDARQRAKADKYLRLLEEFGTGLKYPHVKKLRGHDRLWELRPDPNRILYFACSGKRFVLLHAFSKPKLKIDSRHIRTAKKRMEWFTEGER